jgi:hypothetical protein
VPLLLTLRPNKTTLQFSISLTPLSKRTFIGALFLSQFLTATSAWFVPEGIVTNRLEFELHEDWPMIARPNHP